MYRLFYWVGVTVVLAWTVYSAYSALSF